MLSASSYGHFSSAKEFRSQCHIFRLESRHCGQRPIQIYDFEINNFARGAFPADASAKYKISKFNISLAGHSPRAPLRNIFLPNIKNVVIIYRVKKSLPSGNLCVERMTAHDGHMMAHDARRMTGT